MGAPQAIGFAGAVLPIMVTPGVSVTLVTEHVFRAGTRGGILVAAGTATGLAVHATAATLGLATLVAGSAAAFTVVKVAGAVYLVLVGVKLLVADRSVKESSVVRMPSQGQGPYRQAVLGNVLNPRAASVYLTVLPQFVIPGDDVMATTVALASIHIAMQTAWLTVWTVLASSARRALTREAVRRFLTRLAGGVLIGLGLKTALASRR